MRALIARSTRPLQPSAANSSWFDRAYSTVSPSSATRYATAVADKAYNSEGFKAALEEMATGVAKDAGAQIEKATARVASPVIACVQSALQSRYGAAIAQVFAVESQKNLEATGETPPVKIGSSDLVANNAASISGIVLVVTRRVIAKIVQSVGRRIAGVVASRIVASVAGLVGLALIAKDLYEAGDGVFPIIAERMKADETKTLIKEEIGKSIQADISQQVGTIAQETAERIYAVWLDFKQKYNRLLSLSEKSPAFAEFLKDRRFEQLSKLGQIVDILYASEGEARILERVADGSLNKALLDLTDPGITIAAELKSIDKALQWTALAGRDLPRVAELGVYRWLSPDGLIPKIFRRSSRLTIRLPLRASPIWIRKRAILFSICLPARCVISRGGSTISSLLRSRIISGRWSPMPRGACSGRPAKTRASCRTCRALPCVRPFSTAAISSRLWIWRCMMIRALSVMAASSKMQNLCATGRSDTASSGNAIGWLFCLPGLFCCSSYRGFAGFSLGVQLL